MKRVAFVLLFCLVAALPLLMGDKYPMHVATMVGIMAILALSLNLTLRIGQLSLAHGAFMGLGAYISAILTMRLGYSPIMAMLIASLANGVAAILLGLVILRIKGVFFVLLTYAFGQIVNLVFQEWTSLFGGNNGINAIPKFSWFGIVLAPSASFYLVVLAFATAAFLLVWGIFRSNVGAILTSINEDEDLSRSLGVNALAWRAAVFGLSAAMASVAGSLYAHHLSFVSPAAFSFHISVDLLVMNTIGGPLSAFGPVLGALIVVPLPELLRGAKHFQLFAYGTVLLVCLLFFRQGIMGYFQGIKSRSLAP